MDTKSLELVGGSDVWGSRELPPEAFSAFLALLILDCISETFLWMISGRLEDLRRRKTLDLRVCPLWKGRRLLLGDPPAT